MSLLQAAERYLRASGLRYTIVRPGGLRSEPPSEVGRLIVSKEDSLFGLDTDPGRAISRDTVSVCCSAGCSSSFRRVQRLRQSLRLQLVTKNGSNRAGEDVLCGFDA
jgi:hypothetical protein